MLEATSNGLRQQSVARRAVIKVSCLLKFCQVWCFVQHSNQMNSSLVTQYGFNKDREGIHIVDLLSQLSRYLSDLYLPVLNSAQSSGITIGNFTNKSLT